MNPSEAKNIHSFPGMAKGKREPSKRDCVSFGDFIKALPTAPLINPAPNLVYPMYGNDIAGDCVVAGGWHSLQVIAKLLLNQDLVFSMEMVWAAYKTQNPNFDPNGTASTNGPGSSADNGMDIQVFLEYLVSQKLILGFAKIDHTNSQEMQVAIYIGLAIMTGVVLDNVQMQQFESGIWTNVPGATVDGGHCVPAAGDNNGEIDLISWAKIVKAEPSFIQNQMDEAWFILTQAHVDHPNFRDNFDLAAFSDAVNAITGGKISIPVKTTPPSLFSETLKEGMTGPDVSKLQTLLKIKVDGDFGPNTLEHVMLFQSLHGLSPDGIVGPKTQAALSTLIIPTPMPTVANAMLMKWCAAAQSYEGWSENPMSRSCRNNNPGNLEFNNQPNAVLETPEPGETARFAHFNTYANGLQALYNLFLHACTGQSQAYHPTMSLLDFYNVYAPSSDGNDVNAYATAIAQALDVPVDTQISTFVV